MVSQAGLVTAEELLEMPDDAYRYELVRGELRKMAPAGARHSSIGVKIAISMGNQVTANNLGTVFGADGGFLLERNPDTVRAPDVGFVRRERLEEVGLVDGYWPGPPDLAVEVISPNDLYTEVAEKVEEWLKAGSGMVLVVDPRRRVATVHRPGREAFTLAEGEVLDGEDVVPGWRMAVGDVFG
jgi:Uma2 family endonuclease